MYRLQWKKKRSSLNLSSLYPVKLKVEAVAAKTADLLIIAEGEAQPAAYAVKRTNLKTMKATGSRYAAEPGGVTRIHLRSLEPDTEYRVKVKPIQYANKDGLWNDETSFKTLGGKKTYLAFAEGGPSLKIQRFSNFLGVEMVIGWICSRDLSDAWEGLHEVLPTVIAEESIMFLCLQSSPKRTGAAFA